MTAQAVFSTIGYPRVLWLYPGIKGRLDRGHGRPAQALVVSGLQAMVLYCDIHLGLRMSVEGPGIDEYAIAE